MGYGVVMGQDAERDFDCRNRRHGEEEKQSAGGDILAKVKHLAQRTIVRIVVGRSVALFMMSVRCRDLESRICRDTGQRMDVRLGRKALNDERQKNNGNQEQAVVRPARARYFGKKLPVHQSSLQR